MAPDALEGGGVDDAHSEQQQQIQADHDNRPMAGDPGEQAARPAGEGERTMIEETVFVNMRTMT